MKRFVHLSWLKRQDGELGGVEKFGDYLQRALTEAGHECRLISWSDYPNAERVNNISNCDRALLLGAWVERELEFDAAISDGYWGAGISVHPVIPVVHGTWAQFHVNMGSSPWSNAEVQQQHAAFTAPNAYPVACSAASARELDQYHHVKAHVILHGIDLDRFYPRKDSRIMPEPVVLHAATNDKKGRHLMQPIARALGHDFRVEYLNAKVGEEPRRFQAGDIFLHPSRHEGNAYALLEALSTGLPIVTTPVGLFEDVPDRSVGRILPIAATVHEWADAVREVWGDGSTPYRSYALEARRTAHDLADYNRFASEWVHFLGSIQ